MTKEEAIEYFRKATEDLVQSNVRTIFKAKSGEKEVSEGDNSVSFPIDDDTAYSSSDEYEIEIQYARDANGIDIKDALEITDQTSTGFNISASRAGTVRWESHLRTPNFNFWTNDED